MTTSKDVETVIGIVQAMSYGELENIKRIVDYAFVLLDDAEWVRANK